MRECCKYDSGNCIVLGNGEMKVEKWKMKIYAVYMQSIQKMRFFRKKVL